MTEPAGKLRHLLFAVLKTPADALGLTTNERNLLVQLLDFYNPTRRGAEVWPALATLAELTGMDIKTVRSGRRRLADAGYVSVKRDPGRPDVCVINVDLLRDVCHPYQIREGSEQAPLPELVGDPYQKREGTPTNIGTRTAKERPNNGRSREIDLRDGDHQRKLALPGVVTKTERPTEERQADPARDREACLAAAHGRLAVGKE